jgi:hypothetical protein
MLYRIELYFGLIIFFLLILFSRDRKDYLAPINILFYLFSIRYVLPIMFLLWSSSYQFGRRWSLPESLAIEMVDYSGMCFLLVIIFLCCFSFGYWMYGQKLRLIKPLELRKLQSRVLALAIFFAYVLLYFCYWFYFADFSLLVEELEAAQGSGFILVLLKSIENFLPFILWACNYRFFALATVGSLSALAFMTGARAQAFLVIVWFLISIYYLSGKRYIYSFLLCVPIFIFLAAAMKIRAEFRDWSNIVMLYHLIDWPSLFVFEIGRIEQLTLYYWFSLQNSYFEFGRNIIWSVLGPLAYKLYVYIDYRNAISAIVLGFDPAAYTSGLGGSGVADLWINFHLGGVMCLSFFYGILANYFYRYARVAKSWFAILLYINVARMVFQASEEMLTLSMQTALGPFLIFSLLSGIKRVNDENSRDNSHIEKIDTHY